MPKKTKSESKKWYQSRLVWLGMIIIAEAGLQTYTSGGGVREIVTAVIGAAIIYLRANTTKILGK